MSNQRYKFASLVQPQTTVSEDRVEIIQMHNSDIILLADGAGNGNGLEAASFFIEFARDYLSRREQVKDYLVLEYILREIDKKMEQKKISGTTTAIILILCEDIVMGASVGDSQAWMWNKEFRLELTSFQHRKPLLGSGSTIPIGFGPFCLNGQLLLGSDGLFKYTNINKVQKVMKEESYENIPQKLLSSVRLPSGRLQDDFSVVVVEK